MAEEEEKGPKEIPHVDLDITYPIDYLSAMTNLGGDPNVYFMILGHFPKMSLEKSLPLVREWVDKRDYQQYFDEVHKLKGGSGYIGAGHIHYACYFIQEAWQKKDTETMMAYYPNLLEAIIYFKVYMKQLIAEKDGIECEI